MGTFLNCSITVKFFDQHMQCVFAESGDKIMAPSELYFHNMINQIVCIKTMKSWSLRRYEESFSNISLDKKNIFLFVAATTSEQRICIDSHHVITSISLLLFSFFLGLTF